MTDSTLDRLKMAAQVSHLLQTYIARLEEHAKPVANDKRYMSYVKYINAFLSCFCKERVYLVGSTGEGLKLKRSQNYGDADFIMCSGRLEIPIENIEERPDLRCYVKIRADNLRRDICGELIDGYLSADMLRELRPELFTFLRAIFSEVTTNLDTMPGTISRVTTIGLPMKVGLGAIEFRNLEIDGDILNKKWSNKRLKVDRDMRVVSKLKERWRNVQLNAQDMKITHRILKVIKLGKVPGSKGENFGNINKFADDLDSVMKRIPLEQEQGPDNINVPSGDHSKEIYEDVSTMDEKIKATYTAMATRDFVPALRIIGDRKLACLVEWRKRVEKANWPPGDVAQKIFNTDVYLVARDAPLKADHSRDFCYSFNLAELKLAECLSTTQRQVYLILKSYLSGRLQKLHTGLGKSEMKFKTYYLKTSFFWVCEREDPFLWGKQNVITAVKKVLQFIMQCLQQKRLPHYFVNSNLFVELDDFECDVLQDCIRQILCEPIDSIGDFEFIKDNHGSMRVEILLDVDQVQCLSELKEDGGRIKHLDNLEDALIDIHRGFNESPRDVNGNVPIKEAVDKLFEVFIEEDRQKQISDGISNISIRGAEDGNSTQAIAGAHVPQTAAVAGLLNNFITGGRTLPMNSRESNQRMDLLLSIGSMFRGGPEIIASLGGQDGVRSVLQQTADRSVDPVLELKIVVGKYLSCSDEEEETLAQEILHKATAYFLARQE
ncbi:uncharacterized protein LOC132754574 [Ruditapes philippinarum]|uniref:uncharacterized protein LOC132754574 n=1 Tax=Ruditapes philippinarum TaxID=129788 RepID=UPI00295B274E|nr:uncharacterized protein LOC132754574 [Ruditapes philippinarum]